MKKILLAVVLGTTAVAVAQNAAQPSQAAPAQGQPAAAQGPVIKDPAEYNAYIAAVDPKKDAAAHISGLEAFLTQYPNSIMKNQALEVLLGSYQQAGNVPKALETAQRVLAVEPCYVPAIFLLTYINRVQAQGGDANGKQESADAAKYGQMGLDCLPKYTKPQGTSDADFATQTKTMKENFDAGIGWGALQNKDNAKAAQFLKAATDDNAPDSQKDLALLYPLALSYLQQTPPDYQNGIWYAARAAAIAPAQAEAGIEKYAKSQYRKFHGSEDGWDAVFTAAKAGGPQTAIAPAPSPADQAHDFVTKTEPDKMDFAIWEFVLANGSQADQDTVWNAIKGKAFSLNATMISSTPEQFMVAASADDIDSKTADLTLNFEEKVPVRLIPKDGASFDFTGTPLSYTSNPFMMVMEKVTLIKPKPAAPVHHTTHKAQ